MICLDIFFDDMLDDHLFLPTYPLCLNNVIMQFISLFLFFLFWYSVLKHLLFCLNSCVLVLRVGLLLFYLFIILVFIHLQFLLWLFCMYVPVDVGFILFILCIFCMKPVFLMVYCMNCCVPIKNIHKYLHPLICTRINKFMHWVRELFH